MIRTEQTTEAVQVSRHLTDFPNPFNQHANPNSKND